MKVLVSELRYKEVIVVADGSRYGYVGDVEIDLESGQVRTLIIPGQPRFFGLFGRREDIAVRWDEVCRFGEDIILVEGTGVRRTSEKPGKGGLKRRGLF